MAVHLVLPIATHYIVDVIDEVDVVGCGSHLSTETVLVWSTGVRFAFLDERLYKNSSYPSVDCIGSYVESYLVTRSLSSPQASYPQYHLKYASHPQPTDAQRRWFSRANATGADNKISIGPKRDVEKEDEKYGSVTYYGPISSTIKKVKLLSLSTCCLSVSLGPVITFMTSPDMNVILKGAVASSVIFFSASTTAALHWFVTPYIHKLKWQPGSDTFEVEMMSWLATYLPRTLKFSDIRPAETNRPFVTFKANDSFYFVDIEHCHNKALLARLTPQKPPVHESAFKNL